MLACLKCFPALHGSAVRLGLTVAGAGSNCYVGFMLTGPLPWARLQGGSAVSGSLPSGPGEK
jgi:hypothetical protein